MEHKAIQCSRSGIMIGNIILPHYNKDAASERRIEISLGLDFINRYPYDTIVELGAVLPTHEKIRHDVVDMYDPYDKSIRVDALEYDYTGKNVLSISTIEHIGRNDYAHLGDVQDTNPDNAFKCMSKIINQSSRYLLTFPIGWNRHLEKQVLEANYTRIVMARDEGNNWFYRCSKDNFTFDYGKPYDYANAICIITNVEPYLYEYGLTEEKLKEE